MLLPKKLCLLLGISLLILGFLWAPLERVFARNLASISTLYIMMENPGGLRSAGLTPDEFKAVDCRANWLRGWAADALGQLDQRDQAWLALIDCAPDRILMIREAAPQNLALAAQSVKTQPQEANNWHWLANAQAIASPENSINSHFQGLKIRPGDRNAWKKLGKLFAQLDEQTARQVYARISSDASLKSDSVMEKELIFLWAKIVSHNSPQDGIQLYQSALLRYPNEGYHWGELGDLLAYRDPQAAIQAYLQYCFTDDPYGNGGYRAGLTAERLGNLAAAVHYYRLSSWIGAQQRADKLEKQLLQDE